MRRKGARHNAHLLPDFWSEARSEKQKTNEAHWFVQKRTFIFAMPRTIGAKDRAAGARVRIMSAGVGSWEKWRNIGPMKPKSASVGRSPRRKGRFASTADSQSRARR